MSFLSYLILLLYWVENIADFNWSFLNPFSQIMNLFVYLGSLIMNGTTEIFGAVFEHKYLGAFVVIVFFYLIIHLGFCLTEKAEELYEDSRKAIHKIQENKLNKSLEKEQIQEQKCLNNYVIYVSTEVKKQFRNSNIDLKEQNKIMNKFLIEKTGILPEVYEKGFLYKFSDFNNIDSILDVFFKLLNSSAPIDYVIATCVYAKSFEQEQEKFKKLIALNFVIKISMFADTAYRYSFNTSQKYQTTQLGLFQKGNETVEALCFE